MAGSYEAAGNQAAMAEEQSHREEMNAAIRAQRERLKAPHPPKEQKPPLSRLLGRLRGK